MMRRIGVPEPALRFIVLHEQVDSPAELVTLSKESIDAIFTRMDTRNITYSIVISNMIKLLYHYINRLNLSGTALDLSLIDIDLLKIEAKVIQAEPLKSSKSKIEIPGKFTDDKDWVRFKNALRTYIGSLRGDSFAQ